MRDYQVDKNIGCKIQYDTYSKKGVYPLTVDDIMDITKKYDLTFFIYPPRMFGTQEIADLYDVIGDVEQIPSIRCKYQVIKNADNPSGLCEALRYYDTWFIQDQPNTIFFIPEEIEDEFSRWLDCYQGFLLESYKRGIICDISLREWQRDIELSTRDYLIKKYGEEIVNKKHEERTAEETEQILEAEYRFGRPKGIIFERHYMDYANKNKLASKPIDALLEIQAKQAPTLGFFT